MTDGLSHAEMFTAACAGSMRRLSAIRRGRAEPYGKPTLDLWGMDIESCAAEMLVAKRLGLYWNRIADEPWTLPGDVGEVQVRHTQRLDGRLIVHPRDSDDAAFVLVVGCYPAMRVAGWARGRQAKNPNYWREDTGRPAFFMPQGDLSSIDALAAEVVK